MNYILHYNRLMDRARGRNLPAGTYVERHHVIPKCMGGSNDACNLVDLLPEEHFVAHQLLAKAYPQHYGLQGALRTMVMNSRQHARSNKMYAWCRSRAAGATSKRNKSRWSDPTYRARMSEIHKDKWKDPTYAAAHSSRHKAFWSDSSRRITQSRAVSESKRAAAPRFRFTHTDGRTFEGALWEWAELTPGVNISSAKTSFNSLKRPYKGWSRRPL